MTNLKQGPCGHYICGECACVVERDRLAAELEKMDHNDRAAIEGFHRTIDRYKADLASSGKEMGRLAAENEKLRDQLAEAQRELTEWELAQRVAAKTTRGQFTKLEAELAEAKERIYHLEDDQDAFDELEAELIEAKVSLCAARSELAAETKRREVVEEALVILLDEFTALKDDHNTVAVESRIAPSKFGYLRDTHGEVKARAALTKDPAPAQEKLSGESLREVDAITSVQFIEEPAPQESQEAGTNEAALEELLSRDVPFDAALGVQSRSRAMLRKPQDTETDTDDAQ